ncbi:MAG TPA: YraN family protein [Bacteroidetes bacterium]|nr:YraN family protein [Bacteroidota bacterium]
MKTVEKGRIAEDLACRFLSESGLQIVDRNYRFKNAEVDIVAYDGDEIVFVEVRSKKSIHFGRPEETVDMQKQKSVKQASESWIFENRIEDVGVRFDVIAVVTDYETATKLEITHFRNAFWL